MSYQDSTRLHRIIILLLLFIVIIPVSTSADDIDDSKNILIVHPFAQVGVWSIQFFNGFYYRLSSESSYQISYFYNFLKLDIPENEVINMNIRELENLTNAYKIDMIVGLLPPVHDFLIANSDILFPGIPILLVAAGDSQIKSIEEKNRFYYIKSSSTAAITDTILDIKQMLPDIEHLFIHSGSGPTDLPYLPIFKKEVIKHFDDNILEYWIGDPIEDILLKLSNVPDNSAIMMLITNTDNNGDPYVIHEYFPDYATIANAPIFSFSATQFGAGIIGGTMTSADSYGNYAAIAVNRIFNGNENLINESQNTAEKMYDWRQLKRWDISPSRVPLTAKIMFKEETFWSKYKQVIIITFLIILLQLTTIIFLFNQVKRKKILHHELENKHVQISNSLKEKEILLREVHHRVKNNLTLVTSFLSLQSDYINDDSMLEILEKLQNRIYAMSLVHEQLYKDEGIEQIDICKYLEELCNSVIYSFQSRNENTVLYDIDVVSHNLSMDLMIPIGLIFNELITNSIKYAFNEVEEPRISIKGKISDSDIIFEYSDNGIGLPEDIESDRTDSLGLLIVKTLMIQIKGEFTVDRSGRDRIIFSCPIVL